MNIKNIKKNKLSKTLDTNDMTKSTSLVVDEGMDKKTSGKTLTVHGYKINPKKQYNVVITDYLKIPDEGYDPETNVEYSKEETYSGKDVIKLLNHYEHKLDNPDFDFDVQEVHYSD